MKHVIKYESPYTYNDFTSEDRPEGRFYDCHGHKLPSVTSILSKTKEDNDGIKRWIERVGEEEANRIRQEAAIRGTNMHYILEKQIVNGNLWDYRPDSPDEKQAYKMACKIMDEGFPRIGQVYGCEVSLFNTDKYAGKADVIGIFEGQPAIMDFKQTNKPKRREWIQDYFYQLVAYALAHNAMYGTDIQKGAILMCSVDLNYQEFVIQGDEFKRVSEDWLKKVDQYWAENIFTDPNEKI